MQTTQIAAQLYTVRDHLSTRAGFEQSIERIAAIGYRAVELAGPAPLSIHDIRRACDAAGLAICARHVRLEQFVEDPWGVVREQEELGCSLIALPVSPEAYREDGEGYARFAREVSRLAREVGASGQQVVYHNHDWEFARFEGRTGLEILFAESSPEVGAELDTYWVQRGGGDPAWWIARMAGRCPIVHLKDMVIIGREQHMAEVGEGNLNWPGILDACRASGVRWYVVEQDHCRRDPFESLAISLRCVQSWGLR